jgi:hypothetical protein
MRRVVAFAVFLAAVACFASDKSNLPRQITAARYVYVTNLKGETVFVPGNFDREAISAVENAFQGWRRYSLVLNPDNADIIVVVRSGRVVSAAPSVTVGGRDPRGLPSGYPRPGVGISTDVGPSQDLFEVHDARLGFDSAPLYRRLSTGGLKAPELPLFKDFKKEVEKADKEDQQKQKKSGKQP